MIKTFKFALFPTNEQKSILLNAMSVQKSILNVALTYHLTKLQTGEKIKHFLNLSQNWEIIRDEFPELPINEDLSFDCYGTSVKAGLGTALEGLANAYGKKYRESVRINVKRNILNTQRDEKHQLREKKIPCIPQRKKDILNFHYSGGTGYVLDLENKTLNLRIYSQKYAKLNGIDMIVKIPFKFFDEYLLENLNNSTKSGDLIIKNIENSWIVDLPLTFNDIEPSVDPKIIMGVDLGINNPAVACIDFGNGNITMKFFGNGKQMKYLNRQYIKHQMERQQCNAIDGWHKAENMFKTIDHTLSRQIVDFAITNGVEEIKLEKLAGMSEKKEHKFVKKHIRSVSRHKARALNSWSFYRLKQFITYKAQEAGILVTEVDPAFTSQKCSKCGINYNFRKDSVNRTLIETCPSCGHRMHHDVKGAYNICHSYIIKLHKNDNPEKDFVVTRCKIAGDELALCAVLKNGKIKPIFTWEGHALVGWQSRKTGIIYAITDKFMVHEGDDLFAIWEEIK